MLILNHIRLKAKIKPTALTYEKFINCLQSYIEDIFPVTVHKDEEGIQIKDVDHKYAFTLSEEEISALYYEDYLKYGIEFTYDVIASMMYQYLDLCFTSVFAKLNNQINNKKILLS